MFSVLDWPIITRVIVFIINAIGIVLIFLVYFSDTKSRLNKIFVAMTLLMFIWVDFAFLARLEGQVQRSLLWLRIAWSITPLLFVFIYFFVVYFIKIERKYKVLNILNLFLGILFFVITLFTNLIIKDIEFYNKVLRIIYGSYILVLFSVFGTIIYLTILSFGFLLKRYFKSLDESEKIKIKYLLIGLSFFFVMNSIFNNILPVFFRVFNFYEFGDYSTIFFLGIIAYTIVRKELFGIRVVITSAVVALITILLILDMLVFTSGLMFQLYKSLVIVIFFYFGYLLIRSVLREIEYRERIARAYALEKKARQEIQQLTEAKTQFIMATQHHLRTPLTSMIGYLDLLFGGTYGKVPPKIKNTLMKFQVSTRRLIRVVNALLDISQFQMGKQVVSLQPGVSFDSLISEVMEELQFEGKTRGLYLNYQPVNKNLKIKADQEKMKVALFNIIDNAIKYTKEGGITVTLKKVNNIAQLSVKDTGMGIEPEEAKKLFKEAFARGKEAKRTYGLGRGIGVYVTGHIIRAHNGKIWAESEGRGKGTTFFIELSIN